MATERTWVRLPPDVSGNVLCLEEDKEGRVWFGTETGLFYVDGRDLLVARA
ncbi:MAG: hypothetical protein LUC86_06350 [Prevotellaceae bacterium]|nr:hypothetical protein [Prevotellaceae bacterium]